MNHAWFIHPPFLLALISSCTLAGVAYLLKWLRHSGAISTAIVGFLVFWLGGGEAAIPLIAFFVSSSFLSVLSHFNKRRADSGEAISPKRDGWQVWANGGIATLLVVIHRLLAFRVPLDTNRVIQILFLATLAAVNADTWATELGRLFGGSPRLLSTWRKAPVGTSGAITLVGTLGGLAGALFIPLCTMRLWDITVAELVAVTWAGFMASLFDSILGAGIQGQYRDPITGTVSDNKQIDGRNGNLVRGLPWIDNNVVNLAASISGAFFCWILLHYGLRNVF